MESGGSLNYIENTGTPKAPAFMLRSGSLNPFGNVVDASSDDEAGEASSAAFADLDGDGDPDLVVGYKDGSLTYNENTGTSMASTFVQRTGSGNPFDGSDVALDSTPAFIDLDNDGTLRPRPSIDKLRYRMFCVSRRRPGPRGTSGRSKWQAHLH